MCVKTVNNKSNASLNINVNKINIDLLIHSQVNVSLQRHKLLGQKYCRM